MIVMDAPFTKAAEFVGGPQDGEAIPHEYSIMPKLVLVDGEGVLAPIPDPVVRMYVLAPDGKYHYVEIE